MSPVLDIAGAEPVPEDSPLQGPLDIRLAPGELAVVRAEDHAMARALTLLCAGLPRLRKGQARFLGEEWAKLRRPKAEALRGRIGMAPGDGGWLPHLTVEEGMLLARRHHGHRSVEELRREADELSRRFGLKGLPDGRPSELSRADLARAALARAFLGSPALILLESPLDREVADMLADSVLAELKQARDRGAAAVWTTRSPRASEDPAFGSIRWFVLEEGALRPSSP